MTLEPSDISEDRLLECFAELHNLTRLPRAGLIMAGVRDPESVADHCFEAAVIAYVLAQHMNEPVDMGKVLTMLLFHEVGEARLTDLPRRASAYLKEAKAAAEKQITDDVLGDVTPELLAVLEEFEQRETVEARLAEACEELQILFAALMYAKEQNGDLTEYRVDAANYKSYGIDIADKLARLIAQKLDEYLAGREYWRLGYRQNRTVSS